jgi:THAP domain
MPSCCVPGCKNNYYDRHSGGQFYEAKPVSAFEFPNRTQHPSTFRLWKRSIRRDWRDPATKQPLSDEKIQGFRVCECHFEPFLIREGTRKTFRDRHSAFPTRDLGGGHQYKGTFPPAWAALERQWAEEQREKRSLITPTGSPHSTARRHELSLRLPISEALGASRDDGQRAHRVRATSRADPLTAEEAAATLRGPKFDEVCCVSKSARTFIFRFFFRYIHVHMYLSVCVCVCVGEFVWCPCTCVCTRACAQVCSLAFTAHAACA